MRGRDAHGNIHITRAVLLTAVLTRFVQSAGGSTSSDLTIETAPTLLISFDGFRASYLDAQHASRIPHLTSLWRAGVRASLRPRFISKTFPNHYTLVTGLNENNHGIVANRFFDAALNESFTTASTESYWWNGGEPMWVTARRDGRDAKVSYWPGSASEIKGFRPTEWFPYQDDTQNNLFTKRVDKVSEWLIDGHDTYKSRSMSNNSTNNRYKPPFFAMYFEEPDASGHGHGPFGEVTKKAIRDVDTALGELRRKVGDHVWRSTNIVIVSDHGMAELSPDRVIFLADTPCDLDFANVHVEGSDVVMHVWPLSELVGSDDSSSSRYPVSVDQAPSFDAELLAHRINTCHPNVSAWTRASVPIRYAYGGNPRVGPVVVAADVGWTLCGVNASQNTSSQSGGSQNSQTNETNHSRDWSTEHTHCVASLAAPHGHRGAHGFDNDAIEMQAVFIASGPSFRGDGARLIGDFSKDNVVGLTGPDADADRFKGGGKSYDLAASFWEPKTLVLNNTAVFPMLAAALGISLNRNLKLADGRPPPAIDGVLSVDLRSVLFNQRAGREGDGEDDNQGSKKSAALPFLQFVIAATFSFLAVHVYDRRTTKRWPFEKGIPLVLDETDDCPYDEQQLSEELGGSN